MPYPTSNLDYGDGVNPDPAGDGIPDDLQAALNAHSLPPTEDVTSVTSCV